ncbi:MAG: PDZ domain-containing protein [Acidobacteriia bacterium]|nr:PDZ domain-containing protein [Terriglobia bacterium]
MRVQSLVVPLLVACGWAVPSAFPQTSRARTYAVQGSGASYLGIGVVEVDAERAKTLNLKDVHGAEVVRVDENGPAAKANIKEGDVVLEYNGTPVEGVEQFIRLVRETPAGRAVKLAIWRNGAAQNVTVTVGERQGGVIDAPGGAVRIPDFPNIPPIEIPRFQWSWQSSMLGIEGESLGPERQLADYFGVRDGVLIKQVMRNTPAEKAGLKAGDVITKVNGAAVGSTRDITAQLRSNRSSRSVTLTVVREKHEMPLTVNLDQSGSNPGPNPAEPPGQRF